MLNNQIDFSKSKTETTSEIMIFLESARNFAVLAGNWLFEQRSILPEIEYMYKKSPIDLVTEFDRSAENMILKQIRNHFPQHLILSEEETGRQDINLSNLTQAENYCWVIDPLDGTTNYIHGIPHFAVSIALVKNGLPLIGVVYNPILHELFSAAYGLGATLNGRKLKVSVCNELANAVINTGFSAQDWSTVNNLRFESSKLYGRCRNIRISGSSALDLAQIAAGRIDGFWHWRLAPWDIASGILLVTEAGGRVTGLDGKPFTFNTDILIASNGLIHNNLTMLLNENDSNIP